MAEHYAPAVNENGVQGSGEELAHTLEKIVTQIEIIQKTLQVLDQRISHNEEQVTSAVEHFNNYREQKFANQPPELMSFNAGNLLQDQMSQN